MEKKKNFTMDDYAQECDQYITHTLDTVMEHFRQKELYKKNSKPDEAIAYEIQDELEESKEDASQPK